MGGRAWCAWENLLALLGSAGSKPIWSDPSPTPAPPALPPAPALAPRLGETRLPLVSALSGPRALPSCLTCFVPTRSIPWLAAAPCPGFRLSTPEHPSRPHSFHNPTLWKGLPPDNSFH